MARINLDLTTTDIEQAIDRHDDPDHEDSTTVEDVVAALNAINADIIQHLNFHEDPIDTDAHEIVHEDSDVIVLADLSGHFWPEQFNAMEGFEDDILQTIITSLHHTAARENCDSDWHSVYPVVVAKPDTMQQGEQHVLREIARRTDELGSVARAVDTLAVETHSWQQSAWATASGRADSTVSRMLDDT